MHLIGVIDVRPILPTIRTPTLVLHRKTDAMVPIELGRQYAEGIPGARFIEYPTGDHAPWIGDFDALAGDIEEFVTGRRETEDADLERVLATVLFTDIVDSTRKAAEAGDRQWRRWLDEHDRIVRQAGREASWTVDQEHGRRCAGDLRRSRPSGALRAGAGSGGAPDGAFAARGLAYRRDRNARR